MKFCNIFLVFVFSRCGGAEGPLKITQNELEKNLLAFFNMWLKGDSNTWLPLPAMNVITVPEIEGTYKESGIKLSYATSEMKLTGLPQSYVRELVASYSGTSLAARGVLVAPNLSLFAEKYKLDGHAFFIYPIKGKGEMRVNFQNCILVMDIELGTNGKRMWVEKLLFEVEVDKITIDLTGTSSFIKNTLDSMASSLFAKYQEDLETSLTEAAVPLLSSYLVDLSPAQLLAILSNITRPHPASTYNF